MTFHITETNLSQKNQFSSRIIELWKHLGKWKKKTKTKNKDKPGQQRLLRIGEQMWRKWTIPFKLIKIVQQIQILYVLYILYFINKYYLSSRENFFSMIQNHKFQLFHIVWSFFYFYAVVFSLTIFENTADDRQRRHLHITQYLSPVYIFILVELSRRFRLCILMSFLRIIDHK